MFNKLSDITTTIYVRDKMHNQAMQEMNLSKMDNNLVYLTITTTKELNLSPFVSGDK